MVHFPDLSWDKYLCKISPVSLQTFQQSSVSIQLIIAFAICSIWYLSWIYNSKIPTARRVFPIFCQNTRRCGRCGANLEEKSILWADIKLEYAKLSRSAWQDQAEYDHIYVLSISTFQNIYRTRSSGTGGWVTSPRWSPATSSSTDQAPLLMVNR